jgi:membrane protein insertase Oxa1/YidC/SpoIIIJ
MELFQPQNWDNLILIILFGVTTFLSQKLMVQPTAAGADPEQAMIQQQTQRTMPIAITAMFFFIPLPSGVFLYMVVSNVIQSLQTWLIMRKPALVAAEAGEKSEGSPKELQVAKVVDKDLSDKDNQEPGSSKSTSKKKKV